MPNPSTSVTDVLGRIVNCLIKALNGTLKLPRLIIIIPDEDFLQFLENKHHAAGNRLLIQGAVTWIINQMICAIDAKKDNLSRRKPGSILANEPKIIWVKILDKTNTITDQINLCDHFNIILED